MTRNAVIEALLVCALLSTTAGVAAEPDFEATIAAVQQGAPLGAIPEQPSPEKPERPEVARERGDIFAVQESPSFTSAAFEAAGPEVSLGAVPAGLSDVVGSLGTNLGEAVIDLAEIRRGQGLVGGIRR